MKGFSHNGHWSIWSMLTLQIEGWMAQVRPLILGHRKNCASPFLFVVSHFHKNIHEPNFECYFFFAFAHFSHSLMLFGESISWVLFKWWKANKYDRRRDQNGTGKKTKIGSNACTKKNEDKVHIRLLWHSMIHFFGWNKTSSVAFYMHSIIE